MRKMKILGLTVLSGLFISTLMISWEVPARADNDKIVIGMVDAISGPFKASGDRFQLGAKYAVDEINAKGGLLGKQIDAGRRR